MRLLHLTGLALNVLGTAIIFVFAYPPREEGRAKLFVALSRLAVLLIFFGFLLQLAAAAIYDAR
jgi:hypothetical protein